MDQRWSLEVRVLRACAATVVVGTVVFVVLVVVPVPGVGWVRDVVIYNLVHVAATVAAAMRARAERDAGREWWAWVLVAAGQAAMTAGNLYFSLVVVNAANLPYPAWSDLAFLVWYPLMFVALVRLLRDRVRQWHAAMWFDGVIAGLAAGALAVQLALGPLLELSGDRFDVVATTLAYPVGDLFVMAFALAAMAVLGSHPDRQWLLLTASAILMSVGDTGYAVQLAAGTYREGGLVDLALLASAALAGLAAATPTRHRSRPEPDQDPAMGWWRLVILPATGSLAAATLLIPAPGWDRAPLAQWLAMFTLVMTGLRMVVSYREMWGLALARREARTDELTGLANRRGLVEAGPPLVARCLATGRPVALMMLDLDGFKLINDTWGHDVGDTYLRTVARRLDRALRGEADVLARLGGDEFACLLPGADAAVTRAVAARLQTALAEPVTVGTQTVRATASVGFAHGPIDGATMGELLRVADAAMYRAKLGLTPRG